MHVNHHERGGMGGGQPCLTTGIISEMFWLRLIHIHTLHVQRTVEVSVMFSTVKNIQVTGEHANR